MNAPISWTIHREVVLLLGWGRAILMQFAHPLIACGVAEHSGFRDQAFGGWRRLSRTLGAMLALTFGDDARAGTAASRINAIHARVHGRLPEAAGPFAAGTPYSATDPALLGWVHATLVDSFLLAYERYVGPLSPAERDAYCAESAGIEPVLRIPAGSLPRSAAALRTYVTAQLTGGEIHVTATARELARAVLHPPRSAPAWPGLALLRVTTAGLLPPTLREQYGLPWNARRGAALSASTSLIRALLPAVPSRVRHWPAAREAMRRRTADPDSRAAVAAIESTPPDPSR
jgi:uncharacterized protein (DUF2236 family)